MFKDSVPGLEKLFKKGDDREIPANVLMSGPAGSMKTTFCYALVCSYLKNHPNESGLYISFEEDIKKQRKNMEKLGIEIPKNLILMNVANLRNQLRFEELGIELDHAKMKTMDLDEIFVYMENKGRKMDYEILMQNSLKQLKEKHGDNFSIFVLDSLGAFYSVMKKTKADMRAKMHHFFYGLRDKGLYSFIIAERGRKAEAHLLGHEEYLVDGILEFGTIKPPGKKEVVRFVEIEKMRGCRHSKERHEFKVVKEKGKRKGLEVLGPIFLEED